jgi:hypothetical protein
MFISKTGNHKLVRKVNVLHVGNQCPANVAILNHQCIAVTENQMRCTTPAKRASMPEQSPPFLYGLFTTLCKFTTASIGSLYLYIYICSEQCSHSLVIRHLHELTGAYLRAGATGDRWTASLQYDPCERTRATQIWHCKSQFNQQQRRRGVYTDYAGGQFTSEYEIA